MPRADARNVMRVVVDLERGLRELAVPFGVVGALVPELLLQVQPHRKTNDVDVAVVVERLGDFDLLKDRLADYGFTRTRQPHRLNHRDGGGWTSCRSTTRSYEMDWNSKKASS